MSFRSFLVLLLASLPANAALSSPQVCPSNDADILQGDRASAGMRYADAIAGYQRALSRLEERERKSVEDNQTILCLMDRLAITFVAMGKVKEALQWSLRTVERSRTTPPNRLTATFANNVAALYLEAAQGEPAERWAREAIAISDQTHEPGLPDERQTWTTLASLYAYRGNFARAEPLFRSAIFHMEKFDPKHPEVGLAAGNLAEIYRVQSRHAEAIELYRKAIAILGSAQPVGNRPVDDRQMIWVRSGLMVSCAESGRAAEAESLAADTLRIAEKTFAANDPGLATAFQRVALVRLNQRDLSSARQLCERALAILETAFGGNSRRIIEPLQTYARIERAERNKRAAKQIDARVRVLMQTANP